MAGGVGGAAGAAGTPVVDDLLRALRLGASMTLLQFSIGALNDLQDRHADARSKPGKPIPAGLVPVTAAQGVTLVTGGLGLALAAASGPPVLVLAVVALGIGSLYDLALKGTPWSWVPFALGIPLLPVYGWLGVAGTLPAGFLVLLPVAVVEGAALAIANALVDDERDRAAGVSSIATALGRRVSGRLVLALQGIVAALALATAAVADVAAGWLALIAVAGIAVVAGALVAAPVGASPDRRGAAWAAQAVGAGVLAVSWLGGVVAAGAG